ncbi:MAG: hypothetical protein OQL20_06885 [Sedimenticola sp.]|nr:hypothetical protein [Sedimenticola sp.]
MDRKIFFSILAISLLALAAAILLPGGRTVNEHPKLPWDVKVDEQGKVTVFELTLGKSTLEQARQSFQAQGKANLFLTPDNRYVVEVYFQRLYLSGIRADIVLNMELEEAKAMAMFERGERISRMGNGTRKIELSSDDMAVLAHERILYITYLPAADLEEPLILSRFGEPESRVQEEESAITHWLYTAKGMDIGVNPDGKEVIQYVNPGDFSKVMKPLQLNN